MQLKKLLIIFVLVFVFITIIDADSSFGMVKQYHCINIEQSCANCTYLNITSILYPNSSVATSNAQMTLLGTKGTFTFCNTSIVGTYSINGNGNPDAITDIFQGTFEVTVTGQTLSMSKAITYILIFVVAVLVFVGLLILGIFLPVSNSRDEMTGYILAVNNLKYFKMVCLAFSYVIAIFISYFAWTMSYAYLDFDFVTSVFQFFFYALAVALLPLFILGCYFTISNWVRDQQIADYLSRGLRVR